VFCRMLRANFGLQKLLISRQRVKKQIYVWILAWYIYSITVPSDLFIKSI
jgi:hypothetical protein